MKLITVRRLATFTFLTIPCLSVAQSLPDLTITNLRVNNQCQIEVTIKNLGPGQLPESAFFTGTIPKLQLYRNNQNWGEWGMGYRVLQQPGGAYTHVVQPNNLIVSGSYNFRAVIDRTSLLNEANENNNELSRILTCTPPVSGDDLAILNVSFVQGCRARISIKNTGTGHISENPFNLIALNRTIDGTKRGYTLLKDIDPGGQLKAPGGKVVWTDFPNFAAARSVKYSISGLGTESNWANNVRSASIPKGGCGAVQRFPGTPQRLKIPRGN